MHYCDFVNQLPADTDNPNKYYHDEEYGFPVTDDNVLFERLVLEINQAGLSWSTILKKRENFYHAYAGFDIATVASFSADDYQRLLANKGIIRNRLKINAAIVNAQRILILQKEYGSFKNWLDTYHPLLLEQWVKLFKQNFKFVGKEIVKEFLMSTGYLEGAHHESCCIYAKAVQKNPPWRMIAS